MPSQALLPLLCSPCADWCACSAARSTRTLYKWLLIHYLKSVTLPDCPVGAQHCGGASCRCGQCGVSRPETTGTCPPGSTVRTQCAVRCTCTLHRWSFIHYLKSVTLPDCPVGAQHCGVSPLWVVMRAVSQKPRVPAHQDRPCACNACAI